MIPKLGSFRDGLAVPTLMVPLGHANRQARLDSIEALALLRDSAEVRSALKRTATGGRVLEIRRTAASALNVSTSAPPVS